MKKNRVGWKFDCEQIFHATFSGSSNKVFMLDWFTFCFIQHLILMTSFRMLELRISNDSRKLKRSSKIITIKKIIHMKSKWVWIATKKILTIYLNCKNKMEKNTKKQQEKRKKKKQADQRKYTKETEKNKGWGNLSALAF